MNVRNFSFLLLLLLCPLFVVLQPTYAAQPLRLVQTIPLPGDTSRFDYESLDAQSGLLFIAHLGASTVVIVDARAGKVLGEVEGVSRAHGGVLYVPALRRLYASATGSSQVDEIDPKSFRIVASMPAGEYPDGLAFDPTNRNLYVSDEHGGADVVISTGTNTDVVSIPLGQHVGNTQYDPFAGTILVAVGDPAELAVINPRTNRVEERLPLPGGKSPHGLYIDAPRRLAFVACEDNDRLLTVNLKTMQVTQNQGVGRSPDVLAFDTELRRLYVASEGGSLSVFEEQGSGLTRLGDISAGDNAHSVAVDSKTHRVYLPLKDQGGHLVLRVMAP